LCIAAEIAALHAWHDAPVIPREFIGRASAPLVLEVEKGHIRRFAEALGDDSPIYRDEAAARAAGHARIPAPPTFAASLRPNDAREGIPIDWGKLLHGEQEIEIARPLHAGDRVEVVQRIADIYEKQGRAGTMDFIVLETTGRDAASGEVMFVLRSTVVIKR
jgi:acyl dehydratase